MSELTSRQWALYNALKEQGDEWRVQAEIAMLIPEYDYDGSEDWRLFHDSQSRRMMTADIRAINASTVIQKIIISSPKGIKLANKEEFDRYIKSERAAALRRLMRVHKKAQKGGRDGQMKITFGAYERDTIKAFIDSDKEFGERLKMARLASGMTARAAARYLKMGGINIDEPMLSRFENGYCMPNGKTIAKCAEIYGTTVEHLLTGVLSSEAETGDFDGLQAAE